MAQVAAPATNPFIGSWKLNLKESKLPGPPPADYTSFRIYEDRGEGLMVHTIIYHFAKGAAFGFTAVHYDGKEYPVFDSGTLGQFLSTGAKPPVSVAFRRVDLRTLEYTDRQVGRVAASGTCTVSPDGRRMTEAVTNVDKEGKEISYVMIYDKL